MRRTIPLPAAAAELRHTIAPLARGPYDPCVRLGRAEIRRATHTPDGPGSEILRAAGDSVTVEAFGPGAGWLVEHAPALVGACDDPSGFVPSLEPFVSLRRRYPHLRLTTAGNVVELMVPTILEQKVTSVEAHRSWARLVRAHGSPAPGPWDDLWLPPTAEQLATLPSYAWHAVGVERRRADTVREVCGRAAALRRLEARGSAAFQAAVVSLRGVGPWTATAVAGLAFGDADAVLVGDYHLPSFVAWNLVGERRATDERMLELLEPLRPHRARAVALLGREGGAAPRRGPRLAARDLRGL